MPSGYGTDAGFVAYCDTRNIDISATDPDDYAGARLVVSEWIDNAYESMFPGWRFLGRDQERAWPRYGGLDIFGYVIPSDRVPVEVENATYEGTWRQLAKPGQNIFSPDYTPSKYKRVSIDGAISVDFTTFNNASDIATQYPIIGQWLRTLLSSRSTASSLSGFSRLV